MQTIKSFVANSNLPESLIRGVVRQVGGWDSFQELASDVTNHGASGGFSGFCYYSDTVSFAKRHKAVLLDYAKQMADDLGEAGAMSLIGGFNCLQMSAVTWPKQSITHAQMMPQTSTTRLHGLPLKKYHAPSMTWCQHDRNRLRTRFFRHRARLS